MDIKISEANQFIRLHAHPQAVTASDLATINSWIAKYPYCQSLNFLLTQATKDSEEAENSLARAATFASNREVLFQFVNYIELFETSAIVLDDSVNTENQISEMVEPRNDMGQAFGADLNYYKADATVLVDEAEHLMTSNEDNSEDAGVEEIEETSEVLNEDIAQTTNEEVEADAESKEALRDTESEENNAVEDISVSEEGSNEATNEEVEADAESEEALRDTESEENNAVEDISVSEEGSNEATNEEVEADAESKEALRNTESEENNAVEDISVSEESKTAEVEKEAESDVSEEVLLDSKSEEIEVEENIEEKQEKFDSDTKSLEAITDSESKETNPMDGDVVSAQTENEEPSEELSSETISEKTDDIEEQTEQLEQSDKSGDETPVESDEQQEESKEPNLTRKPVEKDELILDSPVASDFFAFAKAEKPATPTTTVATPLQLKVEEKASVTSEDITQYNDERLPYTFLWWLNKTRKEHASNTQPYLKTRKPAPVASQQQNEPGLNHQIAENIFHLSAADDITSHKPQSQTVPFDFRKKEFYIVEKFIKEEPQIKPPAANKIDTENKAKKSSEDANQVVSETLAKIYVEQMLYHKALDVYKKLSLKYPEKSAYFASQIKYLELKVN